MVFKILARRGPIFLTGRGNSVQICTIRDYSGSDIQIFEIRRESYTEILDSGYPSAKTRDDSFMVKMARRVNWPQRVNATCSLSAFPTLDQSIF